MFNRIFGKPKQYALTTIDKLSETLEMIEKKERVLLKKASSEYEKAKEFLKKASSELEKAKEFTREKNKKAAIQCLERKRLYEQQVDQLRNFQLSIPDQTLEMLKKKEKVLLKKASVAFEKAKEFTRTKNEKAAIQCLKRKRLYIQQVEKLRNFQLRIHDQMIMLEGAKATTETVDALRTGAAAMKAMRKAMNIDDVHKTMDEINEQTENMKQNNFFNMQLQLLHLCMCQLANNLFHLRYGLLKKMKWHFEKVDEIILQV